MFPQNFFRASGISHDGHVRTHNEDSYLIIEEQGIAGVADGLGGHAAGEVASMLAIEALQELGKRLSGNPTGGEASLSEVIGMTVERLAEHVRQNPASRGLATTLTAVRLVAEDLLEVVHVGDCRAYLFRGEELSLVTTDHSTVFARLDPKTREERESLREHPYANRLDRWIDDSGYYCRPDLIRLNIVPGDRLLLATDGVTDMLPEDRIEEILREHALLGKSRLQLLDALVAEALEAGGLDNITAIVIDLGAVDIPVIAESVPLPFEASTWESSPGSLASQAA